jgi:hypothetical protein
MDIYALIGEVWAHKTNLTPPVFIEVPVPNLRTMSGHVFFSGKINKSGSEHFKICMHHNPVSIHEITYEYNKLTNKNISHCWNISKIKYQIQVMSI